MSDDSSTKAQQHGECACLGLEHRRPPRRVQHGVEPFVEHVNASHRVVVAIAEDTAEVAEPRDTVEVLEKWSMGAMSRCWRRRSRRQ